MEYSSKIERANGLMLKLNGTVDHLAMANSVLCHGHVLRIEDGHILRKVLDFVVKGDRRVHGRNRMRNKRVEEETGCGRNRLRKKQVEEETG